MRELKSALSTYLPSTGRLVAHASRVKWANLAARHDQSRSRRGLLSRFAGRLARLAGGGDQGRHQDHADRHPDDQSEQELPHAAASLRSVLGRSRKRGGVQEGRPTVPLPPLPRKTGTQLVSCVARAASNQDLRPRLLLRSNTSARSAFKPPRGLAELADDLRFSAPPTGLTVSTSRS
jgi:hypothetical protein